MKSQIEGPEPDRRYTQEEYFQLLTDSTHKFEFVNGYLVAMAGASINHNRICQNLSRGVGNALVEKGGECEVFGSDQKIAVPLRNSYFFPDLSIVCSPIQESEPDTIVNPTVLWEVTSKSTHGFDAGGKFNYYQSLPSLQEFILVDQYEAFVSLYRRTTSDTWQIVQLQSVADTLRLESMGIELSLAEIYRGVDFAE